jgi:hypothetical protein
MPIDGAVPSTKSVQAHSYPYWRPTFYYTNGDPSGLAKDLSISQWARVARES